MGVTWSGRYTSMPGASSYSDCAIFTTLCHVHLRPRALGNSCRTCEHPCRDTLSVRSAIDGREIYVEGEF